MEKFIEFIETYDLIGDNQKIIVALSGGADSMALLHMLMAHKELLDIQLSAIHIHHGLRQASDLEAEVVEVYCEAIGIKCTVVKVDVLDLARKGKSIEEAARFLRYEAFEKLHQLEGGLIAMAHHQDDQCETVLLNLFRGSGLKGLGGMRPKRDFYIRPMLTYSKEEILDYCSANKIAYVTDESNLETEYTRNRLRLDILPLVEKHIQSNVAEHISQTAMVLQEEDRFLNEMTLKAHMESTLSNNEHEVAWSLKNLMTYDQVILTRILRHGLNLLPMGLNDITRRHSEAMVALIMSGKTGKGIDLPHNRRLRCDYDKVTLEVLHVSDNKEGLHEEVHLSTLSYDHSVTYDKFSFRLVHVDQEDEFPKNLCTKWFDYDKIRGNLVLRNREKGDYIRLTSFLYKKKLKDYFIDQKVERAQRNKIPVVAMDNEVVWIVGYRINEAYKVTKTTRTVLEVVYFKEEI